ncbi:hypothetical protein GCM10007874_25480 [Labrys miyagiensis]|uniref:Uncharacterized protein n=1 Tax=Labrys miyagiensis TaxID=346912 RepID=A0ABQ6CH36_9HYPH|nr:hypothetical protein [Labrys miyagiensis]GLS19531.1 hypothetical protein GCM10007874_25480 [Labrys miyagiensis]
MNYDQMFDHLRGKAKGYADTVADDYSCSTFMGALGSIAGGAIGGFTIRDPMNLATLALGGAGKTVVAKVTSEMGVNAVSQAVELTTGSCENQKLLGQAPTDMQMAEPVVGAGIGAGAGILRTGGEDVAAGFRAIAQRFGAKAPDVAALPPRPSAFDTAAKKAATITGARGPHGKVDITVKSKDNPVGVKSNDSPLFREIKVDRGPRMEI